MARKKDSGFNIESELNFTQNTQETNNTLETRLKEAQATLESSRAILQSVPNETAEKIAGKRGRPPKKEKLRGYRYNLNLDSDLNEYLHEIAWRNRTSMTQYINDLIRHDMENNKEWTKK